MGIPRGYFFRHEGARAQGIFHREGERARGREGFFTAKAQGRGGAREFLS